MSNVPKIKKLSSRLASPRSALRRNNNRKITSPRDNIQSSKRSQDKLIRKSPKKSNKNEQDMVYFAIKTKYAMFFRYMTTDKENLFKDEANKINVTCPSIELLSEIFHMSISEKDYLCFYTPFNEIFGILELLKILNIVEIKRVIKQMRIRTVKEELIIWNLECEPYMGNDLNSNIRRSKTRTSKRTYSIGSINEINKQKTYSESKFQNASQEDFPEDKVAEYGEEYYKKIEELKIQFNKFCTENKISSSNCEDDSVLSEISLVESPENSKIEENNESNDESNHESDENLDNNNEDKINKIDKNENERGIFRKKLKSMADYLSSVL